MSHVTSSYQINRYRLTFTQNEVECHENEIIWHDVVLRERKLIVFFRQIRCLPEWERSNCTRYIQNSNWACKKKWSCVKETNLVSTPVLIAYRVSLLISESSLRKQGFIIWVRWKEQVTYLEYPVLKLRRKKQSAAAVKMSVAAPIPSDKLPITWYCNVRTETLTEVGLARTFNWDTCVRLGTWKLQSHDHQEAWSHQYKGIAHACAV